MHSFWPTMITLAFLIPFLLTMTATLVPFAAAILPSVSPPFTTTQTHWSS